MSMPRKLRCTVESIVNHSGRVYTVTLKPDRLLPPFFPGQFLNLTVDDYDPAGFWPESRVFSIASSPRERDRIRICYSIKGHYTQKMERALAVGRKVWVKLPYGEFIIQPASAVVLFAGGTGISAFAAFMEMLAPQLTQPVTLVYGARSPELLLFSEMIMARFDAVPAFDVIFFVEQGAPGLASRLKREGRRPRCLPGRIALPEIWPHFPNSAATVFYLAGPPAMIAALSACLQAQGADPNQIRINAWE